MRFAKLCRPVPLLAATAACILALGACSAGSLGSNDEGGATTLTFLVDNATGSIKPAQGLAEAFHAKNPDITVQVQQRPGGADGDNIVKTRLSTGEMTDVFLYNSGSLFQALNPQKNLIPLTGEAWANQVEDIFKPTVSVGNELYGAPITGVVRRRHPLQQEGVREAGSAGADDLGRVHGQQRQDQGRRHRPGDPELPGHLDLAAVRPGRLPQRRGRRPGLGREVHRRPGEVRPGAGGQGIPAPGRGAQGRVREQGLPVHEVREGHQPARRGQGRALPHAHVRGGQPGDLRPRAHQRRRVLRPAR